MVPNCRLREYVLGGGLQPRPYISPDLHLHSLHESLRRHHSGRIMHRQTSTVHGNGSTQHVHGYHPATLADSDDCEATDAAYPEVRRHLHFRCRISDVRYKRSSTRRSQTNAEEHRSDMGNCNSGTLDVSYAPPYQYAVTDPLPSLIEANLVIITGSLPVLRLFLRHVAPRLIGESTFNSGSRSRNQDHTWNSEANGHTHHQSELKNIHLSVKQVQDKYGRLSDDDVSIGSEERAAGWKNDASSETGIIPRPPLLVTGGILRTQSTVITSEHHAR